MKNCNSTYIFDGIMPLRKFWYGNQVCLITLKPSEGYSIKRYPGGGGGGDPILKMAKPPLEEIFYIFQDGFSYMYVNVCTHLFRLTPTMCLLKMSLPECFYRFFLTGRGGGHKGSIMSGLPTNLMIFQLTQSRAR